MGGWMHNALISCRYWHIIKKYGKAYNHKIKIENVQIVYLCVICMIVQLLYDPYRSQHNDMFYSTNIKCIVPIAHHPAYHIRVLCCPNFCTYRSPLSIVLYYKSTITLWASESKPNVITTCSKIISLVKAMS